MVLELDERGEVQAMVKIHMTDICAEIYTVLAKPACAG